MTYSLPMIALVNGSNLSSIDTITGNKDLERKLTGAPRKITEMRDGNLLVEVSSEIQCNKIMEITSLASVEVSVSPHRSLKAIKGTIRYYNLPDHSERKILKELKQFHVTEVNRISYRNRNDRDKETTDASNSTTASNFIYSNIYILTFEGNSLPSHINI